MMSNVSGHRVEGKGEQVYDCIGTQPLCRE